MWDLFVQWRNLLQDEEVVIARGPHEWDMQKQHIQQSWSWGPTHGVTSITCSHDTSGRIHPGLVPGPSRTPFTRSPPGPIKSLQHTYLPCYWTVGGIWSAWLWHWAIVIILGYLHMLSWQLKCREGNETWDPKESLQSLWQIWQTKEDIWVISPGMISGMTTRCSANAGDCAHANTSDLHSWYLESLFGGLPSSSAAGLNWFTQLLFRISWFVIKVRSQAS